MIVHYAGGRTVEFAAEELSRYLSLISGARVRSVKCSSLDAADGFRVGEKRFFDGAGVPHVEDPRFDDAVYVRSGGDGGVISGANPRSVLLAVYRYLREIGCRWVRPGRGGEYLPGAGCLGKPVSVAERPSYRHRGICIEGANSYENVRDIIDWAPKAGFNSYFTQFRESYTFFERWYAHKNNPLKPPEPFGTDRAGEYLAKAVEEITARGLLYHAVGHGWTCEPLGVRGLGWDGEKKTASPGIRRYLAEVDGRRDFWQGVPINTNLCYSSKEARGIVNRDIAAYAGSHPEVDFLHFWLADGVNNHCECPGCRRGRPSDFYVRMLNELDELMTAEGLKAKIVFLIYVDLLWPPVREKIKNPDRFVLMFAPITRTYDEPLASGNAPREIPRYRRNRLDFPKTSGENLAFLKAWQDCFDGDSFDFDYHYMWAHYKDLGHHRLAGVLGRDIKNLAGMGLNGFISCQVQRAFFPTGFGMAVMGGTLWNSRLSFGEAAADYYQSAFGPEGKRCFEYLDKLSGYFVPSNVQVDGRPEGVSRDCAEKLRNVPRIVEEFRPVIARNMNAEDECRRLSWRYLSAHADICVLLAGALEKLASGEGERAAAMWEDVKEEVCRREDELQPVLDVFCFIRTLEKVFKT